MYPATEHITNRTAVYGPVRTVVWEGSSRKARPYPDHGWSGGAAKPADAEPVESMTICGPAPGGAKELS